jgi:hypothetical protein
LRPLSDRLDHIDRLLASVAAPPRAPALPTDIQVEGVRELSVAELAPGDASELARWYAEFGTPDERPMSPGDEGHRRSDVARALLKADGTLREPLVDFGDRELLIGDRVVSTRDLPALGLAAGVPGVVESIDLRSRMVDVDFSTWGRLELPITQMLDDGIGHDYVTADVTPTPQVDMSESIAIEASRIEPGMSW